MRRPARCVRSAHSPAKAAASTPLSPSSMLQGSRDTAHNRTRDCTRASCSVQVGRVPHDQPLSPNLQCQNPTASGAPRRPWRAQRCAAHPRASLCGVYLRRNGADVRRPILQRRAREHLPAHPVRSEGGDRGTHARNARADALTLATNLASSFAPPKPRRSGGAQHS